MLQIGEVNCSGGFSRSNSRAQFSTQIFRRDKIQPVKSEKKCLISLVWETKRKLVLLPSQSAEPLKKEHFETLASSNKLVRAGSTADRSKCSDLSHHIFLKNIIEQEQCIKIHFDIIDTFLCDSSSNILFIPFTNSDGLLDFCFCRRVEQGEARLWTSTFSPSQRY